MTVLDQSWLLLGGYSGVEGQEGTETINKVELLSLTGTNWCQLEMEAAVVRLEGSTMDFISMFDFMEGKVGDANYTSPHSSMVFERILVCGGIDQGKRERESDTNLTLKVLLFPAEQCEML